MNNIKSFSERMNQLIQDIEENRKKVLLGNLIYSLQKPLKNLANILEFLKNRDDNKTRN